MFTTKYDGGCKYAVMVVVDEISRCTVVQCNAKLADDINLSPNLNVFTDKYDGGCKYAVMVVVDEIPSSV